jgi:Flp pilus assembly protein protease CpaA
MHSAIQVAALSIFSVVAYHDVRTRRTPNALSLAIAGLGLVRIAIARDLVDGGYTLAAGRRSSRLLLRCFATAPSAVVTLK